MDRHKLTEWFVFVADYICKQMPLHNSFCVVLSGTVFGLSVVNLTEMTCDEVGKGWVTMTTEGDNQSSLHSDIILSKLDVDMHVIQSTWDYNQRFHDTGVEFKFNVWHKELANSKSNTTRALLNQPVLMRRWLIIYVCPKSTVHDAPLSASVLAHVDGESSMARLAGLLGPYKELCEAVLDWATLWYRWISVFAENKIKKTMLKKLYHTRSAAHVVVIYEPTLGIPLSLILE